MDTVGASVGHVSFFVLYSSGGTSIGRGPMGFLYASVLCRVLGGGLEIGEGLCTEL